MNIFVLNTGRCGSVTFIKACSHISNYTSGHESRVMFVGSERFDYPANHIEADNRLSWFLGRLDTRYGDKAIYVHLKRNSEDVARSFANRYSKGIIDAYRSNMLMHLDPDVNRDAVCRDYCDTVNSNIDLFLKDKTHKSQFCLENAKADFPKFWERISASGDLDAAISEFDTSHNATKSDYSTEGNTIGLVGRVARKFLRKGK